MNDTKNKKWKAKVGLRRWVRFWEFSKGSGERDRHVDVESRPLRIGTRVSGGPGALFLQPVLTELECRSSPDSALFFVVL